MAHPLRLVAGVACGLVLVLGVSSGAHAASRTETRSCRLDQWRSHHDDRATHSGRDPLAVVVGGSFTAGVGAVSDDDAWPYRLADLLHWRVVARGVPGAGYVARGWEDQGPMWREVRQVGLRRLHPRMVVLQAGHNDIGAPTAVLRGRVRRLIRRVRAEVPTARLVVVTVFTRGWVPSPAARRTDRVIVTAARAADRHVIVLDPLKGRWRFPTIADRLHPDDRGHEWIARRVETRLLARGLHRGRRFPQVRQVRQAALSTSCGDRRSA